MRLGKSEAKSEAIRIASVFVSGNGCAGWTCLGAHPDLLAIGYKCRKSVVKWVVVFERSIDGLTVDGPGCVRVDISTGESIFF